MAFQDLRDHWALVTGASSGLGTDFARELARLGCHLVLVARREERLNELAREVRDRHGVQVDVVALDLGTREGPGALHRRVQELGRPVDVLVNNAGFGVYGTHLEADWDRERGMLDLDIAALVHLTKLFAGDMVSRGFGRILQVASIAAYQPCPTYAAYGAAKSFVLHFGEAVNFELRGTGVSCTVLSPGVTRTEFFEVAGQSLTWYQRLAMMQSEEVARTGIEAMVRGRSSVVPGLLNKFTTWSVRFLPRDLATALSWWVLRPDRAGPSGPDRGRAP